LGTKCKICLKEKNVQTGKHAYYWKSKKNDECSLVPAKLQKDLQSHGKDYHLEVTLQLHLYSLAPQTENCYKRLLNVLMRMV